jgi:hypothetical protein
MYQNFVHVKEALDMRQQVVINLAIRIVQFKRKASYRIIGLRLVIEQGVGAIDG